MLNRERQLISKIDLPADWLGHLEHEFKQSYMISLKNFLIEESKNGKIIYPKGNEIFSAFKQTPLSQVKVVIIGQDPYHGANQAHGMSFSVKRDVKLPPSLVNIYKELQSDIGFIPPRHGYLLEWAQQGVLLLNSVLTVEASRAASHRNRGWELFTDKVVEILNQECEHLVFMLWGSPAQKKGKEIDSKKHLILKSPHPSPLSAYRGFFGQRHFSKANAYLKHHHKTAIDWQLTE